MKNRAFEYATVKLWKAAGYSATRTAGSHGKWDVIAERVDRRPEFIQCKLVNDLKTANRLLERFRATAIPSEYYHQSISVRVKGEKIPFSFFV